MQLSRTNSIGITSKKEAILYVTVLILHVFFAGVFGTPEGAVRRYLLFSEGIHSSFSAKIKKTEAGYLHTWDNAFYDVTIDGTERRWTVTSGQYTCHAKPDN